MLRHPSFLRPFAKGTPMSTPETAPGLPVGLTEKDLQISKKAVTIKTVFCGIAFLVSLGIAVFVLINVPWDTRMPYSGRNGIVAPIALLPCPLVLFGFWLSGEQPAAHHMGKGSRIGYYILAPAIIVACVWGEWILAEAILIEAGFLQA
jgi:hypothetical protein